MTDPFPPGIDPDLRAETEAVVTNYHAWVQVLDQLERDIEATEKLARSENPETAPLPAPWEAPPVSGPVPEPLLPRAREIHRRQAEARAALGVALAAVRGRQQLAQRQARTAPSPPTAAYVDLSV
jgi:hypothetical protein